MANSFDSYYTVVYINSDLGMNSKDQTKLFMLLSQDGGIEYQMCRTTLRQGRVEKFFWESNLYEYMEYIDIIFGQAQGFFLFSLQIIMVII